MSNSAGGDRQAVQNEAQLAARRTWNEFEKLGDRLDELQREYDDEDAREAYRSVEDLVMELDDVLAEAQEAVRDE